MIGLLGKNSLLGIHLRLYLKINYPELKLIAPNKEIFKNHEKLRKFLLNNKKVFLFSWLNKGTEEEIKKTNTFISKAFLEALSTIDPNDAPVIIFTSSIHENKKNAFGKTKKMLSKELGKLKKKGYKINTFILPHVFGEFGKPFHNSVVSTFCKQLALGKPLVIKNDSVLQLTYAGEVIEHIFSKKVKSKLNVMPMKVSELKKKLELMSEMHEQQIVPDISNDFDLYLFNTLRSFINPLKLPKQTSEISDERGDLSEILKIQKKGMFFYSSTNPGFIRGNHFHSKKFERFIILSGKYKIEMRNILKQKVYSFDGEANSQNIHFIDMPTFFTHNIKNTSKKLPLNVLFFSSDFFNPDVPDTYWEQV